MKRLLLIAMLVVLVPVPALAAWGNCENPQGVGSTTASPGGGICYNFSSTDVTGTVKSFEACREVFVSYDEDSDTETLCIDACTSSATGSCAQITAACITGAAGNNTFINMPPGLLRPRLTGGTPSNNPQARFTCIGG